MNNSVNSLKIADRAVTSIKIAKNTIVDENIADSSITGAKLAQQTITQDKIANYAIGSNQLNDNAVIARTIANEAIDTRHYKDNSINNNKLAQGSIYGSVIKDNGISSNHMNDNAIVTRAIANGAITQDKLADNSVGNNAIIKKSIESTHLSEGCVTNLAISDNAISTSKYQDKSITKNKLADDVVKLIGDPVMYDENNNVDLRKDMHAKGNVVVDGTLRANKVFNAVFMDIAEAYEPNKDEVFTPGDIVQVNEEGKLTRAESSSHFPIVGVVSDEYAACYGATEEEIEQGIKVSVGLIGKIHVNVIGSVQVGDKIALIKNGIGASCKTNNLLKENIIGKALETNDKSDMKKILCLVFPS